MNTPVSNTEEASALEAFSPESNSELSGDMRRRIATFAIIIPAFLLIVTLFTSATWSHFSSIRDGLKWDLVPVLLAIAFVPTTILGTYHSGLGLRLVYAASAIWLGLLSFCFFAAIVSWMVEGAAGLMGWPLGLSYLPSVFFGLALLAGGYGLVNAAWIRVTSITVELPHLPEAWRGRSVALVTDLHLGHLSGPRFLRRVISRLRRMRPDAVFISGDMFDGTRSGLDRLVAPWRQYSARRGIYFVTGNHEEITDRGIYLDAVKRTGIRVLNNEKVMVDGLQIVGVHDAEAGDPRDFQAILRRTELDRNRPSILLAHQPANLRVAEEEGVSLQLSGHTHQGQFWPWNLVVSRMYGKFAYGLARLGKMLVYTSSGAGTWGPPLRVGTKSEIVLIRLEKDMTEG